MYMDCSLQEAFDNFKLNKEDATCRKIESWKPKQTPLRRCKERFCLVIDCWDNLTLRKTKLTIHSSSLSDALVSKDGETLCTILPVLKRYQPVDHQPAHQRNQNAGSIGYAASGSMVHGIKIRKRDFPGYQWRYFKNRNCRWQARFHQH